MTQWIQCIVTATLLVSLGVSASAQEAPKVRVLNPDAAAAPTPPPAASQPPASQPSTSHEQVSYYLGINLGIRLRTEGVTNPDFRWLLEGILDAYRNQRRLTDEQLIQAQQAASKEIKQRNQQLLAHANKYLEENKKKEGVKTTKSGLQYTVYEAGKGPTPTAKDNITVKYAGRLRNGQEFLAQRTDKVSIDRIRLAGMREALSMMNVGSKWQLAIPPALGFGGSMQPKVPPYSVLIVDVEVIAITPAPPTTQPAAPAQ